MSICFLQVVVMQFLYKKGLLIDVINIIQWDNYLKITCIFGYTNFCFLIIVIDL